MAWDHMEVRGNKCNPYTQDLLELDSYLPVAGQVSNKMLAKVNTPLQVTEWERAMASHPDREFVEYLLRGIREGFRIGYNYRGQTCSPASKNMLSARQNPQEEYLAKGVKEGRVIGPPNIPTPRYPPLEVPYTWVNKRIRLS